MSKERVIVIGAGISGLKAAIDIHAAGIKDVLVLEARNRIGGRIYTTHEGKNSTYDIGASWFHAAGLNPLFLKSVAKGNVDYFFDDNSASIVTSGEDLRPEWKIGSVVEEIKVFARNFKGEDTSLHNVIASYLKQNENVLTPEQKKYAPAVARLGEIGPATSWDATSGKFTFAPYSGRDAFNTSTYEKVLENEVEGFPKENILLGKVVTEVVNDSGTFTVKTALGDKYEADFVVVSIPQPLLKLAGSSEEGAIKFSPPLPFESQLAKTSHGTLAKVVLEFDSSFWPDSEKFLIIPDTEEINTEIETPPIAFSNVYQQGDVPKTWEFPALVANLKPIKNVNSLVFLIPSPAAQYFETSAPSAAWPILKPILEKIAPGTEIPEPTNIIVTNWSQDPYSRGTISASAPSDLPIVKELANGWGNIRFAGEHTIEEGKGCAHGAWLSGKREADYIIEHSKDGKGEGRLESSCKSLPAAAHLCASDIFPNFPPLP
ncbi:unnamed protein product [Kuraishia capsulata CBS 1993]|uniref:Amine oxidase domain-containing protein n=1 Tax=Kuraishia capsulata CBS 1993 TaxID=1382522 RepID=W6MKR7_9ASCO|nr:uncharacterized protein KUCA_T00003051001 [Kuraishia capsulata CBS 1993]CDK27074.1 unnamed protein product [Kuraishia capsulata CBS 1993]